MRILTLTLVACLATAVPAQEGDRAFLGIGGQTAGGAIEGFVLTQVHEGTAASKAGFRAGDVLIQLDGKKVTGFETVRDAVAARKPGDKIGYKIQRAAGVIEGFVILGRMARPRAEVEVLDLREAAPVPAAADTEIDRRIAELEKALREIQREITERLLSEAEKLRKQLAQKPARFHGWQAVPVRPQAPRPAPAAGPRRGPPERVKALEDRMDRIEAKVDRILKLLEARPVAPDVK